jgi:hypothetical protein
MRAAVEYISDDVEIASADAFLRRESRNNAVVSGCGVIVFNDGSTTTWNCGFESGGVVMDLRISGKTGVIKLNDFLTQSHQDHSAGFERLEGWGNSETVTVPSTKPGAALMFEDFTAMVGNREMAEASMHASERTQKWLDAVWNSAIQNEGN